MWYLTSGYCGFLNWFVQQKHHFFQQQIHRRCLFPLHRCCCVSRIWSFSSGMSFAKELAAWTWHIVKRWSTQIWNAAVYDLPSAVYHQPALQYQHLPTVAMSMSCTAPKKCRSGLPGTAGDTGESHAKACPDPQKITATYCDERSDEWKMDENGKYNARCIGWTYLSISFAIKIYQKKHFKCL